MQAHLKAQAELEQAVGAFIQAEGASPHLGETPSADARFMALATQICALQCQTFPLLGRLAEQKGWQASDPPPLWQWPMVPALAYKHLTLMAQPERMVRTFRSSGTTGSGILSQAGYSSQGLALMDVAIEVNAQRMLFGNGKKVRLLVMAPSPEQAPGMIMAYGMQKLMERFGRAGSQFLIGRDGFQLEAMLQAIEDSVGSDVPFTWVGGTVAFARFVLSLEARQCRFTLPPHTRWMDAGGFKAQLAGLSLEAYHEKLWTYLGISPSQRVNLLGMTELPSQLYSDGLAAQDEGRTSLRGKRIPVWMRSFVLDPVTMEPAEPGQPGLLLHFDLCNIERPLGILTEDIGVMFEDGSLELLGRAEGAALRGCAFQLEQLLGRGI